MPNRSANDASKRYEEIKPNDLIVDDEELATDENVFGGVGVCLQHKLKP